MKTEFFNSDLPDLICRKYNGLRRRVVIADLDVIQRVLIKDFHVFTNRPVSGTKQIISAQGRFLTRISAFIDFREVQNADQHGRPKMEERSPSYESNFFFQKDETGTFIAFSSVRLSIQSILNFRCSVRCQIASTSSAKSSTTKQWKENRSISTQVSKPLLWTLSGVVRWPWTLIVKRIIMWASPFFFW